MELRVDVVTSTEQGAFGLKISMTEGPLLASAIFDLNDRESIIHLLKQGFDALEAKSKEILTVSESVQTDPPARKPRKSKKI